MTTTRPLDEAIFGAWADALDALGQAVEAAAKRGEAGKVEQRNNASTKPCAARG